MQVELELARRDAHEARVADEVDEVGQEASGGWKDGENGGFIVVAASIRLTDADMRSAPPRLPVWDRPHTSRGWLLARLRKPPETMTVIAVVGRIAGSNLGIAVHYDGDVAGACKGYPETLGHAGVVGLAQGNKPDRLKRARFLGCFVFEASEACPVLWTAVTPV